mmetsp:Transcript_4547/g.12056  ORF Transcript_4547/g.12056 Transcript_4547/m.12056 type:complete len:206 (-) Transcript_4547:196-813(-)
MSTSSSTGWSAVARGKPARMCASRIEPNVFMRAVLTCGSEGLEWGPSESQTAWLPRASQRRAQPIASPSARLTRRSLVVKSKSRLRSHLRTTTRSFVLAHACRRCHVTSVRASLYPSPPTSNSSTVCGRITGTRLTLFWGLGVGAAAAGAGADTWRETVGGGGALMRRRRGDASSLSCASCDALRLRWADSSSAHSTTPETAKRR